MFLLGVFLWAPVRCFAEHLRMKEDLSETEALAIAAQEMSARQLSRISMPRRFTGPMRDMLALQPRFANRHGRRALKFLEHRRFRAAYDFMVLRAEVGEIDQETADFWTGVQKQGEDQRLTSFELASAGRGKRRQSRRRRKSQGT
jgi:poly(A) polymerase